ncbi:putative quinol monooxygenase [Neorhizobium sp. BT27B]
MTTPVVAIFVAKAGSEQKLEELFRGVIETTLKEEGCITYQLNRDANNPSRFIWTEEWTSQALLDKHLSAPHIAELFAQVPDLVESSEVLPLVKLAGGAA